MILLQMKTSGFDSFIQLLGVLLIFIFVLAITYFTTKWIAGYQKSRSFNKNLRIVETLRLTQNKYIQIIEAGEVYLVIGVGKDEITMLTTLTKEQLQKIAEQKMPDLNAANIESAMSMIAGTCRSMGVVVED